MGTMRNPYAGVAESVVAAHTAYPGAHAPDVCSYFTGEQLAGTAKSGTMFVLLEHYGAWGKDVLDGRAFGPELTPKLKAHLKSNGAAFQLIRKPGVAGRSRRAATHRAAFLIWSDAEVPVAERLEVESAEDLLALDLSGPGKNPQAEAWEQPLLLVCTHGKRDRCCAIFGRPVVAALGGQYPEMWEASHVKGHRFAPAMLLLPHNYSFGRLNAGGVGQLMETARIGQLELKGNRGRGIYDAPGQVAELAARRYLHAQNVAGALAFDGFHVTQVNADEGAGTGPRRARRLVVHETSGRRALVHLEQRESVEAMASCGGKPKRVKSWVAVRIEEPEG